MGAAISIFILVAVLGSQAGITHGKFTEPSHPVGVYGNCRNGEETEEATALLELLSILDMVMGVTKKRHWVTDLPLSAAFRP